MRGWSGGLDNAQNLSVSNQLVLKAATLVVTNLAVGYDTNGQIVARDSAITLGPLGQTSFVFSGKSGFDALTRGQGNIKLYALPDPDATEPAMGINCLLLSSCRASRSPTLRLPISRRHQTGLRFETDVTPHSRGSGDHARRAVA